MGIQTVTRHYLVLNQPPDRQYHAHNPPGGRETAPGTAPVGWRGGADQEVDVAVSLSGQGAQNTNYVYLAGGCCNYSVITV